MGFQETFESENVFAQSNVSTQQVESSRWMEQQQKKRDGAVRCVCEERWASERRKSAEPEVVHGSVPARWYTLEWLWSAPCESVQPVYRWPAASTEASQCSEWSSGLASVRPRLWQTTLARLFWVRCSLSKVAVAAGFNSSAVNMHKTINTDCNINSTHPIWWSIVKWNKSAFILSIDISSILQQKFGYVDVVVTS